MLKLFKRLALGVAGLILFIFAIGVVAVITGDEETKETAQEVVATEEMDKEADKSQEVEVKKEDAKEPEKKEKKESVKDELDRKRKEYGFATMTLMDDFQGDMETMSELYGRMSNDPSLIYDEDFVWDLNNNAKQIEDNQKALMKLEPPADFKDFHERMLSATEKITVGVRSASEAVVINDVDAMLESAEMIQQGNLELNEISGEIYAAYE